MSNNVLNKCPGCGTVGALSRDAAGAYTCCACNGVFAQDQIEGAVKQIDLAAYISEAVRNIDSPEAAVAYLATFFEGYDWETYNKETELDIADLRVMVEKNKIMHPIDPKSWQLEAESLIVPLNHKLESLVALQEQIADGYHGDVSEVADEMSTYNVIADALIDGREELLKTLNKDLQNMEKFNAEEEALAAVRAQVKELKAALLAVATAEEVEGLPVVLARMEKNVASEIAKYAKEDINAAEVYENGKKAFEENRFSDAMAYFAQIKTFRDVSKYINQLNSVFVFGEIVEAGGKIFQSKAHKAVIDMSEVKGGKKKREAAEAAAKAAAAEEEAMGTKDLFEITDAVPAEKPAVKSLSTMLCAYGDYIYYVKNTIKNTGELCVCNLKDETETVLDKSEFGYDLNDKSNFGYSLSRDKIYIRKLLKFDGMKKGCFSFINKKKKEEEYKKSIQNNYAMLAIDLAHGALYTAIEKMVGCICVGDLVFFTVSEVVSEDKKHGKTYKNVAKMHNLATNVTEVLFEKNCEILAVEGTKVLYSFWTPNSLNRQLRVIDYITKEDMVLEDNIYNFLTVEDGKVYYRVGNKAFSPLFSINLDGTGRTEIMPHYPHKYLKVFCNWVYLRRNNVIIRVSADGSKKSVLASNVKTVIKYAGNNLYYIDVDNGFRIARLDGSRNVKIATNIEAKDISVGTQYVYYLREELVGDHNSNSLYRMDLDGHNIQKMLFDIYRMKEKSSTATYVLKKEIRFFQIESGKNKWVESFNISTYYCLNKVSGEMTPILVLGIPDAENYKQMAKKGCALFKKKVKDPVITEVFPEIDYGQITEEGGEAEIINAVHDAEVKAAEEAKNPKKGLAKLLKKK